jgi:HD-GYP domain-containing protein (c-di-GMP phosphodiesterase class II)
MTQLAFKNKNTLKKKSQTRNKTSFAKNKNPNKIPARVKRTNAKVKIDSALVKQVKNSSAVLKKVSNTKKIISNYLNDEAFLKDLTTYCDANSRKFNQLINENPLEAFKLQFYDNLKLDTQLNMTNLFLGSAAGVFGGTLINSTKAPTVIHELGHKIAVSPFLKNDNTTLQADVIDNFNKIKDADSTNEFFTALGDFFKGKDALNDDLNGYFSWSTNDYNELGKEVSPEALSAISSISGCLPILVINSLFAYHGFKLDNNFAKAAIAGIVLQLHLSATSYPMSAALKSSNELASYSGGHDFITFSNSMSEITGLSAKSIAIATVSVYAATVPIIAYMGYLANKGSNKQLASNSRILFKVFERAKDDPNLNAITEKAFDEYKEKNSLIQVMKEFNKTNNSVIVKILKEKNPKQRNALFNQLIFNQNNFYESQEKLEKAILKKVPKQLLNQVKKELKQEMEEQNSKVKNLSKGAGLTGVAGVSSLPTLSYLGNGPVPELAGVSSAMSSIMPGLVALGLLGNSFIAYNDLKNKSIPKRVKRIDSSLVGLSAVNTGLAITTAAAPPASAGTIPALISLGTLAFALSLKRSAILTKRNKDYIESIKSYNWYKHLDLLKDYNSSQLNFLTKKEILEFSYWLKLQRNAILNQYLKYPEKNKNELLQSLHINSSTNADVESIANKIDLIRGDLKKLATKKT